METWPAIRPHRNRLMTPSGSCSSPHLAAGVHPVLQREFKCSESKRVIMNFSMFQFALSSMAIAVSLVSLYLSLRSAVRAQRNTRAEQNRFIDSQWQQLNAMILSNEDIARIVAGEVSECKIKLEQLKALRYFLINILSVSYHAWGAGIFSEDQLNANLSGALEFMSKEDIIACVDTGSFSSRFKADMLARLAKLPASSNSSKLPPAM
jgi:hypothetical protein